MLQTVLPKESYLIDSLMLLLLPRSLTAAQMTAYAAAQYNVSFLRAAQLVPAAWVPAAIGATAGAGAAA